MLTLVRKDIAVVAAFGWLIVWLVAPSYLVPAIAAARTGRVFLWVNVAFAAAAIVSVCLLDARSGADRFIHSLPVRRATSCGPATSRRSPWRSSCSASARRPA